MLNWDNAPKHSSFKAEVTIIDGEEPIRSGFFMSVAVLNPDALFGSTVHWPIEMSNYSKIDDVSVDQNLSISDAQKLIVALQEAIVLAGGPPPASEDIKIKELRAQVEGGERILELKDNQILNQLSELARLHAVADAAQHVRQRYQLVCKIHPEWDLDGIMGGEMASLGKKLAAIDANICPSLGTIASEQPQFADMPVCSGQPIIPFNPDDADRGDLPGAEEYHDA